MKKIFSCLLITLILMSFTGCGGTDAMEVNLVVDDILSPMAVYTMAVTIAEEPAEYIGKTVQAEGNIIYSDESSTGYFIEIADHTGCCYQNLEFQLADGLEYPEDNTLVLITGTFSSSKNENGTEVIRIDADSIEDRSYLYELPE